LQYIDQWKEHNLKTDTLRQILAFLGLILSGPSEFTQSLLIKFPNFIAALKNILPISPIFNQIQIPSSEWLHTNNSLILGSLFASVIYQHLIILPISCSTKKYSKPFSSYQVIPAIPLNLK